MSQNVVSRTCCYGDVELQRVIFLKCRLLLLAAGDRSSAKTYRLLFLRSIIFSGTGALNIV